MNARNEVYLTGAIKYAEVSETRNGGHRLKAKIYVPFTYVDKSTGEEKVGGNGFNVTAWNELAEELGSLEDGTEVEVVGTLGSRKFDGNCKSCGTAESKFWVDVTISDYRKL